MAQSLCAILTFLRSCNFFMTTLDRKSFESNSNNMNDDPREEFVVRVCRLPSSATAESLAEFFSDCNIRGGAKNGIHFTYSSEGRPSGECFVELVSLEDMENALAKSNNCLGNRYVEVFKSKAGEMEWTFKGMGQPQDRGEEAVVQLRNLPFQVSKEEISQFFTGLEIVPNGITITLDEDGRTTGDAFVEFASPDLASQAMKKNKEFIGNRSILISKSSKAYIKYVSKPKVKPLMSTQRGPYDKPPRGFGGGHGQSGGVAVGDGRRFRGRGGPVFGGGYGGDYNGYGVGQGGSGSGGRGGRNMGGRGGSRNHGQSSGWAGSERRGQNFGFGNSGGDNFSSNDVGSVNCGGNQINTTIFGGQANQSIGLNSLQPQQQQQQSNFSNQMGVGGGGGSFGNQGNSFSSNAGAFYVDRNLWQ